MKLHKFVNDELADPNGILRVAMIIQGYHPAIGGAERQLKSLVPFLQKENCQIHIFTRQKGAPLAPTEIIDGAVVHRIACSGPRSVASLSFTFQTLLKLKQLRPHIVHAHELLSPTTTAVAARRTMGTPVVAKVLGGGVLGDLAKLNRSRIGRRRIRYYAKWVNRFITVSTEIGNELAVAGVSPEKQAFIPNGVDTSRFFPADSNLKERRRHELQLPGDPIAVYTGRFASEKRLESVIELWPEIRKMHPFASLLLIGSGDEETKLTAAAQNTKGVYILGAVHDVVPYLQAADLFVLPSEREGLSNSMLEAMACGLPVVATKVGGASDVIHNGENGVLIPYGDGPQLHSALLRVLHESAFRIKLGVQAHETILNRYSLATTAKTLRSLYDSLLAAGDVSISKRLEVSA